MAKIDELVKTFLAEKVIAVVGVSTTREDAANAIYTKLKEKGYTVYGVNPRTSVFKGDTCYPDLQSLPEVPGSVMIVTKPDVTELIAQQCVDVGVKNVWMHNMSGTNPKFAQDMSCASTKAVQLLREKGVNVIPGSCPMQFVGDFGHACMRGIFRMMGALEIPA
jgi:predicted CoA-binding protein